MDTDDENEQKYYQQMGTNFHNPKKPMAKNYRSPTISAASKAISPRKKVLTERNEGPDEKIDQTATLLVMVNPVTSDESLSQTTIPNKPMPNKNSKSVSPTPRKKILLTEGEGESLSQTKLSSPTISAAASEAITPRKKILTERNEDVPDEKTHQTATLVDVNPVTITDESSSQTTPNKPMPNKNCMSVSPTPRKNFSTEGKTLSQTKLPSPPVSSKFNINDEENVRFPDSSSQRPYDPLTNYLSPRPQFRRYKPNRRSRVLFGRENGIKDGSSTTTASQSGSFDDSPRSIDKEAAAATSNCTSLVSSPSSSSSGEGSVKQEDEELDETDGEMLENDSDDEDESGDQEEESSCNSKGALKTLLLIVVLVLFASCISSMHPLTPVCDLEFPMGIKDGYYNFQNNTFDDASLVKKFETGKFLLDHQKEEKELGFMEVTKRAIEKGMEEGNIIEAVLVKKHENIVADFMYQLVETETVLIEGEGIAIGDGVEEEGRVEDRNFGVTEVENFEIGETEGGEVAEGEKIPIVNESSEVEEQQNQGTDEVVPYQMVENLVHQGTAEKIESSDDYLISSLSERHHIASDIIYAFLQDEVLPDSVEVYSDEAGEEEMVESRMESVGNFTNLADEDVSERMDTDTTTGFDKIINLVNVDNLRKELIKLTGTESLFKVFTWVMMFSVIVASLVLGFHLKHKDNSIKKDSFVEEKPSCESVVVEPKKKFNGKDSSLTSYPYSESVLVEKCTSVLPSRGDKQLDQQLSSFRNNLSASIHFSEEASEEYYQSRAPTVQFLSEIEVEEVSSSLRSSVMKNKKTESEENNHSVSLESKKMSRRLGDSVSVQAQPTKSEFSTMDSSSYGSYTTEQKIMRKEVRLCFIAVIWFNLSSHLLVLLWNNNFYLALLQGKHCIHEVNTIFVICSSTLGCDSIACVLFSSS